MRRNPHILLVAIGLCFLFAGVPRASALKVKRATWEQFVQSAAFMGVVECEENGFNVVKCRVLESWKGPKPGAKLTIKVWVWAAAGEFFQGIKGQRYLVAAFVEPPGSKAKVAPVAWEYFTPYYQGIDRLNENNLGPFPGLGSPHPNLRTFKKAVLELLAITPEELELKILKTMADQNVRSFFWDAKTRTLDLGEDVQVIQQRYRDAKTIAEFMKELVPLKDCEKFGSEGAGRAALSIIVREGWESTLEVLKSLPPFQSYQNLSGDISSLESKIRYLKQLEPSNSKIK